MDIFPPYEVYIDEANTPVFETKLGLNSPYVVCAIAIPVLEKKRIELLLPRDKQGGLIKASSQTTTDGLAAQFIEKILEFDVLFSLIGLDAADEENCKIATVLTEKANRNRNKRIKKANLMYARVAAQAIVNIWGSDRLSFFDVIFDSNSLPKHEFSLFESILKDKFGHRGARIRKICRKTEQQASLLYAADLIAGVGKRQSSHHDLPESWDRIIKGQKSGKVFIENGLEVYNAG